MEGVTATIHSFREVALKTHEVTLRLDAPFFFEAGQSIELCINPTTSVDKRDDCRNFSIVSTPSDKNLLTVVLRDTNSVYERSLLGLPIGSKVVVTGPFGNLSLPQDTSKEVVFIAGGVGIAPFMSMAQLSLEKNLKTPITLLYANTNTKQALYIKELENIAQKNSNFQLKLKDGDIDTSFIRDVVENTTGKKWCVAGSPAFVLSVLYQLREIGIHETDILFEEMSGYGSKMSLVNERVESRKIKKEIRLMSKLGEDLSDFSSPLVWVLSELAMIVVTDADGNIIYTNDFFRRISQYSESELIGKNYNILNSGKYTQSYYDKLANDAVKNGKILHEEMSNRAKDGSIYWADSSMVPHFGENGEVTHFVGVGFLITDKIQAQEELNKKTDNLQQIITEMKVNETELENTKKAILNILEDLDEEKKAVERRVEERTAEIKSEKEKLQQVTKNIRDGVVLINSKGLVIFANEGLYQLFDLKQEDTPESNVLPEIFKYLEGTNFKDLLARCFAGEIFTVPEIESQGKIFEIFFNNLKVKDDMTDSTNYLVLISDVTEAKLLERSKSELVAVASHQLRTPLTAVRGNIEMLIDESYGPLNTEQHELLSDVDISTVRLISMVNDMLDITKIERGNLDMVLENVSIKETVDSICSDLEDYAKRRGVVIEINIAENTNVYGDKSRVRQVMQNLIDNSIKYSKGTGVLNVSGSVEGKFANINFKDNGQGIPKLEQSKIFNRFYRASNVKNNSSSGSGLGLYIVKSIVEQLHGSIRFESEENVGTTFFVSLPTSD